MNFVNQVTLTGRVAKAPRKVPGGGYIFSLFQKQNFDGQGEVPIYPVVVAQGDPPPFLRVNQPVIVVGRVRTRNFEQDLRRLVARALRRAGKGSEAEAIARQLPADLREPRVAIEIYADHIAIADGGEM